MHTLASVLAILAVLAIGVVSPGPSFLFVARTAVANSRRAAVAAAIGMALGATAMCVAALLGLHALFTRVPELYLLLKGVGGAYLLYLALRIWRSAAAPLPVSAPAAGAPAGLRRPFLLALGTMLSNPKAAVQYGVIFAAMLPAAPPPSLLVALPPAVFVLEATWYTVVALGLSAPRPRGLYLRAKPVLDRCVGVVLATLGLRLIWISR
jgi:threonine/homoserine/homoserine lactone efflux protein